MASATPNLRLHSQRKLVLISPTHRGMARLSWPEWLVTYRDSLPARRRSCTHTTWCIALYCRSADCGGERGKWPTPCEKRGGNCPRANCLAEYVHGEYVEGNVPILWLHVYKSRRIPCRHSIMAIGRVPGAIYYNTAVLDERKDVDFRSLDRLSKTHRNIGERMIHLSLVLRRFSNKSNYYATNGS